MSTLAAPRIWTTEEMLALPDDGKERWLICGQLWEKPMTVRNRWHSRALARICYLLQCWLEGQPPPRGAVLAGEAGCRLRHDPDTTVGIDVAYIGPELAAGEPKDTTLIDGIPILAVEVLSPSDTQEDIEQKVDNYLQAGVALVWVVDPHDRTVLIYQRGVPPTLVNETQELSGEPHLPGFCVAVARIFD
jgi:Uma2 family endonuclease